MTTSLQNGATEAHGDEQGLVAPPVFRTSDLLDGGGGVNSHPSPPRTRLIGVAGHVDHGKTALVEALTGVNADRLPEERRRGMTIDIGFAYAAPGRNLGFIDLPGHERFLHNFLAGALVLDEVLLVIAADEGPRRQTLDHLAILERIGIRRIAVALTKVDRVDNARLQAAQSEVRDLLAPTPFATAPVIATSARSGRGVPALRDRLCAEPPLVPPAGARFRFAIDRVFSLPGSGLIVTGAAGAGRVSLGDRLILTPSGRPVRVRGLQCEGRTTAWVGAGERCGLALAGAVGVSDIRRGDGLVHPDLHRPATRLLAMLRTMPGGAIVDGRPVRLHLGTASGRARVFLLDRAAAGAPIPALLLADQPLAALAGDRLVLRDASSPMLLAAGRVADPFAPERRVLRKAPVELLRRLADGEPRTALETQLAVNGAVDLRRFSLAWNLPEAAVRRLVREIDAGAGDTLISPEREAALESQVLSTLRAHHEDRPDRLGLDGVTLARRLSAQVGPSVAAHILETLEAAGRVVRRGAVFHLPDHRPMLAPEDARWWASIAPRLEGGRPPAFAEIGQAIGRDHHWIAALMKRLEHFGLVVCVARNRAFLPTTIAQVCAVGRSLGATQVDRLFDAGAFARNTGLGRNLAIQMLEFLDRAGVTERLGDQHRFLELRLPWDLTPSSR